MLKLKQLFGFFAFGARAHSLARSLVSFFRRVGLSVCQCSPSFSVVPNFGHGRLWCGAIVIEYIIEYNEETS